MHEEIKSRRVMIIFLPILDETILSLIKLNFVKKFLSEFCRQFFRALIQARESRPPFFWLIFCDQILKFVTYKITIISFVTIISICYQLLRFNNELCFAT